MRKISIQILLLTAALSSFTLQGQAKLTVSEMKEDFNVFQNSIQDIHPGLYWYYDSTEITTRFNNIRSELDNSMELSKFYTLLQGFYATIGCGHSWMSMPFSWRQYLDTASYRMPFDLFLEEERAFVLRDYTEENELEGQEVLEINGVPWKEILKELMNYIPSDGYNQTHKRSIIAGNFSRYYQTMIQTDTVFEFQLRKNEEVFNMHVKGITRKEALDRKEKRYPSEKSKEKLLSYQRLEEAGYLKIKTFDSDWIKNQKQNYPKFLAETFEAIANEKTENLILDLRGNGGGDDDYGSLLCQYLVGEDFNYFDRMEAVTKRFDYKKYSNTKSLNLLAGMVLRKDKDDHRLYTYNKAKGLKVQKPQKNVFKGNLFVLTNGGTFSTSADVAAILHANNRGTFLGEEVGGGYYGNNSAMMYDVRLPNSKVTYYIPVIRYYSAVDYPAFYGFGVKPDIAISSTYESYVLGKDEVLTKALSEAKK